MTIDRTENRFTYWFSVLILLHTCGLFYLASYSYPISAYENLFLEIASKVAGTGEAAQANLYLKQELYPISPLSYGLSAAGHWLLPNTWIGYRLFHILFYLAGLVGFYFTVKRFLDVRTAFYSCSICACSLLLTGQMYTATPEGLAAVFIGTALLSFFVFLKTNQQNLLWVLYGSLTLGLLSKGLISIIVVLIIIVLFLMFRIKMNNAHLNKIKLGTGLFFVFLLAMPWHIYVALQDGGNWVNRFIDTIHWQQTFGEPSTVREGAFYLPFIFIILSLVPFGFFLPKSFGYSWKIRQKKPLLLLSTLSLLLILLFYAFADTFSPHFLLPAVPFTALIIAYQLSQLNGRSLKNTKLYIGMTGTILLAIAAPVVLFILKDEGVVVGLEWVLYFMIAILPIGTMVSFTLWSLKRTDEAVAVLALTYLIFTFFLVYISRESAALTL